MYFFIRIYQSFANFMSSLYTTLQIDVFQFKERKHHKQTCFNLASLLTHLQHPCVIPFFFYNYQTQEHALIGNEAVPS